ncbi:hypothetical protein THOM_0549 [Trachipleistophora hominis]|uniref:Uncharacterized protein n=1 Tax=Trachipleistophora hominis TaxID=72359 RepID=L7JZP4_TRAHO|nr:hypothetical protein THOM_0549 [Trachipleistophora hominis]
MKDDSSYNYNTIKKKLSDGSILSLDALSEMLKDDSSLLLKLYKEVGNIAIRYKEVNLISLKELLCYGGVIDKLDLELPVIQPVIDYLEINLQKRWGELMNLEELPLYIHKLSSHVKLRIIEMMSEWLNKWNEGSVSLHTNDISSDTNIELCSMEDISDWVTKFSDDMVSKNNPLGSGMLVNMNMSMNTSNADKQIKLTHKSENDLNIKYNEVVNDRAIMNKQENINNIIVNKTTKSNAIKHIKTLVQNLSQTELNNLKLDEYTTSFFIPSVKESFLIPKLFSIEKIIVNDILWNKNYNLLKNKIKTYVNEQSTDNINILLFKLLFGCQMKLSYKDSLILIDKICLDCLVFFLTRNSSTDISQLVYLMEQRRFFYVLILSGKNKISREIIEVINSSVESVNDENYIDKDQVEQLILNVSQDCKYDEMNNGGEDDYADPGLEKSKWCNSYLDAKKLGKRLKKNTSCINYSQARNNQEIGTSDLNNSSCPFVSFICGEVKKFKNIDIEPMDYILYTIKTKQVSSEEKKILEELNVSSYKEIMKEECHSKLHNKPQYEVNEIKEKPFHTKYLSYFFRVKTQNTKVFDYLLTHLPSMNSLNCLKTLTMVFSNKIFYENDFLSDDISDNNKYKSFQHENGDNDACDDAKENPSIEVKNEKHLAKQTFDNYVNSKYNQYKYTFHKLVKTLPKRHVAEILNFPYNLNSFTPCINHFTFNLKKFYQKITYHTVAYRFLNEMKYKNDFLLIILSDKRYDILHQLKFLSELKEKDINETTHQIILNFYLTRVLNSDFVEESHIMYVKEMLDYLLTIQMSTETKRCYDNVLLRTKQYMSIMGLELKVRNVRTTEN